eukprot:CAMPEP_0114241802 /NCGR_PEP_ID=MMETSP0058-20121206/9825_1 /TAXON_ID=36894 /ORGANISM="Pyramimonas parkeae, CCMP726" /LENGTH=477 /DNA_ID=CAMNT_0001354349 /DNA_START=272 /DNA_END=1704 /DNA_ORIENTATION=+
MNWGVLCIRGPRRTILLVGLFLQVVSVCGEGSLAVVLESTSANGQSNESQPGGGAEGFTDFGGWTFTDRGNRTKVNKHNTYVADKSFDAQLDPRGGRILSVILYWDARPEKRDQRGGALSVGALQAWDKFFKRKKVESLGALRYEDLRPPAYKLSDIAIMWNAYERHKPSTEYRKHVWYNQIQAGKHVLVVSRPFFAADKGYYSVSFDTGSSPDPCGGDEPTQWIIKNIWARNMTSKRWQRVAPSTFVPASEPLPIRRQGPNPLAPGPAKFVPAERLPPHYQPDHILFLAQAPWDSGSQFVSNYWEWLRMTIQLMQHRTDLTIRIRPDPKQLRIGTKGKETMCYKTRNNDNSFVPCIPQEIQEEMGGGVVLDKSKSLAQAIQQAYLVVGYNHPQLLMALIAEKPVIALSPCTPAATVAMHNITRENLNKARRVDPFIRDQLYFNLAYYQYTAAEIIAGEAWEFLSSMMKYKEYNNNR